MATISKGDTITSKLRGRVGNLIFKQYADKTVVQSVPTYSNKKRSIVQQFRQHHFRKAVRYAKSVLRDPALRAQMEAQVPAGKRLYNYLVKLYCNTNALIDEIDDGGTLQGTHRFVQHALPVSAESLVLSHEYKMPADGPCSFLIDSANRVSEGVLLLKRGFSGVDAMAAAFAASLKRGVSVV